MPGHVRNATLREEMMNTVEKDHAFGSTVCRLLGAFLCVAFVVLPLKAQQQKQTYELGLPFIGSVTLVNTGSLHSRNPSTTAVVIPSGTILPVQLNSPISFAKCKPGQKIKGTIMDYVPLSSGMGIPEGTKILGQIVEVIPATNSAQAQVSLRFDKLVYSHQTIPITTNLRAIAGFMEVFEAQTPRSAPSKDGGVPTWQTTTQIGGEVVYRGGDRVATAENAEGVVGSAIDSVLLVKVTPKMGTRCRGVVDGNQNPQALWVFSSDACGTYGLPDVKVLHAGRTNPKGLIILKSNTGTSEVRAGAGMLLRVSAVAF